MKKEHTKGLEIFGKFWCTLGNSQKIAERNYYTDTILENKYKPILM